jgi:WD40-like Beta Propeller Repeat
VYLILLLIPVFVLALLSACSGSSGGGSTTGNTGNSTQYSIELDFSRLDNVGGLDPFTVTATVLQDGTPTAGLLPSVQLERGSYNSVTDLGDGTYRFTVTPTQTGEYPVTVSYENGSLSRTALVLKSVHTDWGQPMSVPGLVNTEGYEDGVTISPDGQYLFVQTGPQYFSAYFVYLEPRANGGCGAVFDNTRLSPDRCNHPWIDTLIGPYTAPERPGFFDGRFSGNTFLHNSNIWGVGIDESPFFAFATMFYGFKKQPDGSFTEPFYIAFDDLNDAIANPFGMSFRNNADGSMTMIFAHNDGDASAFANGVDSGFDVYTIDITPGQNNILGKYNLGQPPTRDSFFPSSMIDFGSTGTDGNYGTQGNPHLYVLNDGSIDSIWTDDEYDADDADPGNDADAGDLSVYTLSSGSFPDGNWNKTVLPATINAGSDQIQPFFTGAGLYFTQDTDILYSVYSGADTAVDYANDSNWSTPVTILQKDAGDTPLGKIIAIGEPTIANENGVETLYFVYGYVRSVDVITGIADVNLQAGFVRRK